jgi:F0F1-type ATP synthase membrane subunit b/b'
MAATKESLAKSFDMIDDSMEKMWDMWLVSLGSLSGTQEQLENMTRKQLDQNKAARQELIKLVEDLSKEMRGSQEQFQKMVEETVKSTYEQISSSSQAHIAELAKKVEELAKKVDKK